MKAVAEKLGVSSPIYLKDLYRTEKTKIMTSELDRDYIQELTTLRDLKNNGMYRGEVVGTIQIITGASLKKIQIELVLFPESKAVSEAQYPWCPPNCPCHKNQAERCENIEAITLAWNCI